jgi:hypothetical protein
MVESKQIVALIVATIISLILSTQQSMFAVFASESSPYDSGYDHGCDDAGISDPDDRYINQPDKGPSHHTGAFMQGYDDGFGACSSSPSPDVEQQGRSQSQSIDVLENAQDCYDAAYGDGQDFPFDGGANDFCRQFTNDQGNPYYTGFIDGCMSIQGNTIDVCESATD